MTVTQGTAPMLNVTINNQNRISSPGFQYDAAGNMLTDASVSYTWDAEARMKTAGSVTYTYAGDGKRVKKSNGKLFWYGTGSDPLLETDLSGNLQNEYIFFGGRQIAGRDVSGNVYFYLYDHLGSSRAITNSSGNLCYDADPYPFGSDRVVMNNCGQNYKYAGLYLDSETGNYHAQVREFVPNYGRWLTPDLHAPSITNPQSLNKYAYAFNISSGSSIQAGCSRLRPTSNGVSPAFNRSDFPGPRRRDSLAG